MDAEQAIARSISHNEIVTIDYSGDAQTDLLVEADDWTDNGDIREYWGTTDDGDNWRVHMRMADEREDNTTEGPPAILGYNVYRAPEGCAETFLGFVETLEEAHSLEGSAGLPEHLYATARAAGHCDGVAAPDKSGEAEEPTEWFGRDGSYCAVAVSS